MTVTVEDPNTGGMKLKDFGEDAINNAKSISQGGSAVQNNNDAYGVLSPEAAQSYNGDESAFLQTLGLTTAEYNQLAQTNQISAGVQQQVDAGINSNYTNQQFSHDNYLSSLAGDAALATTLGVATAGLGSAIGPALGASLGTTGGAVATGAISGAAGSALRSGLTGQPLTAGSVGTGALMGGAGAAASGLLGSGGLGLDPALAKGLAGAGTGALRGALTGSGAGMGALSGGVSGALSGLNSDLGGNAFTGALVGFGASQLTNAIGGSNNVSTPNPLQAATTSSGTSGTDINSLMQMLGGATGTGLGIAANNNQSSMQQNAYTTAGNAANYQPWSVGGVAGGAQFNNGQISLGTGGFNPNSFSGLSNSAYGQAQQYANGGLPAGVTAAGNTAMSQYGMGQTTANQGVNQSNAMYNQGSNLVNGANGNYNSAYNTSLNAATQALQPSFQQQTNALQNQQFSTGMSGTSGGALQTQAVMNAQNQALLQAQQNAVGQANTAYGTALNSGTSLMNSGLSNMGNFNTQGSAMATNGLNAQQGLAAFSPQLAGMYSNVGQQGVTAASGLNQIGTSDAGLGLTAMQTGGNNMNNAARTQGAISQSSNYTNPAAGYATALNSLFGSAAGSGASGLGGLGSLFSSLFGGSSGSGTPAAYGADQTGSISQNGSQLQMGAVDASAPSFDFSNIGNAQYDPSQFDNIWAQTDGG